MSCTVCIHVPILRTSVTLLVSHMKTFKLIDFGFPVTQRNIDNCFSVYQSYDNDLKGLGDGVLCSWAFEFVLL
jgi:hypothetical protein